jgi:hypothetical protein
MAQLRPSRKALVVPIHDLFYNLAAKAMIFMESICFYKAKNSIVTMGST